VATATVTVGVKATINWGSDATPPACGKTATATGEGEGDGDNNKQKDILK